MLRYQAARSIRIGSRCCARKAPSLSMPTDGCVSLRPDFRCSMQWWPIWLLRVVPANAGTNAAANLLARWQPPSETIDIGGYGSRLALRLAGTTSDYAPKLFGEPATGTPPPV